MTASSLLLLALLITPLSCIAAVDPLWREFFLVNTCGCNLTLFFVDHEMNERLLIKADIESVSQINSTGLVGDELEVVETVNTTANCTGRKATFHINDNYDQVVFIEEGLQVFVEDDMTVHQSRFRLNEDFSLFYDMNSLIDEDELIENPHDTRIVWQRRLFRKGATFALMENKLLCHSLLLSYGIPKAEIYYGAFASKAMGEWPQYDRNDFISTLKTIPQVTEDHLFVMKPATGQNSEGTIVMNHKKWIEEGWSFERLADQVEAYFSITASYWGQQYEHLGVVVQQSVLSQDNVVEFHAGSFENISSLVFEFEPHVVFGTLCGGELHLVPHNEDYHLKINYCHGDARLQDVSGVDPSVWEIVHPKLLQSPGRLAKTAKRIAHAFGADWFRLDVFIDLNGMFYVNEVTYPSGMHPSEDCTYPLYYHMYKHTTLDILEPRSVLEPLLRRINVSYDVFIESTDYKHMTDLTEEEWDDYILSIPHQFEEDVFWSETEEDEEEEEEDEDDEWEDEW